MFECRKEFMIVLLDARGPIARGGAIDWRTDLVLTVISTALQCGVVWRQCAVQQQAQKLLSSEVHCTYRSYGRSA